MSILNPLHSGLKLLKNSEKYLRSSSNFTDTYCLLFGNLIHIFFILILISFIVNFWWELFIGKTIRWMSMTQITFGIMCMYFYVFRDKQKYLSWKYLMMLKLVIFERSQIIACCFWKCVWILKVIFWMILCFVIFCGICFQAEKIDFYLINLNFYKNPFRIIAIYLHYTFLISEWCGWTQQKSNFRMFT